MNDLDELLEQARDALQQVSEALRKPGADNLEDALALLRETRGRFRSLPAPPGSTSALAPKVARTLTELRVLAEQAGAFYLGLAAGVLSSSGSYTAAGEAALPSGCQRVSVEG